VAYFGLGVGSGGNDWGVNALIVLKQLSNIYK
jgi:hypothetical protein